jgi:hypothetical protein
MGIKLKIAATAKYTSFHQSYTMLLVRSKVSRSLSGVQKKSLIEGTVTAKVLLSRKRREKEDRVGES